MLSMRTMIDNRAAAGMTLRLGVEVGEEAFGFTIIDGVVGIGRGLPASPHAILRGETGAVAALLYAGVPLIALEADGALTVTGDRALVERLPVLFPLPEKAALG
jgi:hypothetical protein